MGFQFLGPRSTVLSPSDPRPPTVLQAPEIGDGSREMAISKIIALAADMCGSPRPRAGGMLLESTSFTYYTLCITCLPARGSEMSDHEAGCSFGRRGCGHSQSGSDTWDQEAVQWQYGAFALLQLLDTADLPGTTALIVPTQCYQGMWKKTTQQWIGTGYSVCQTTQKTEAVGFWHEFQWLDWRYLSCGYLASLVSCPLGPCGVATAAKRRRTDTGQRTRLGWTRKWL